MSGEVAVVEFDRLRTAVLDALPNRCCEDWRSCPYDQHEAGELLRALRSLMRQVWDDGQTAGYQGAHSSLNQRGYIERGFALPNPWCDGDGIACGCNPGHRDQRTPDVTP